jgi:peptidoglycan/xylan/chitin deacetylase (PgdA/CDA1 family)
MDAQVLANDRPFAGVEGAAQRIAWRFGVSPRPMEARLARFDALTAEFGVRPSWAIPACVLRRSQPVVRRFAERGVDFAVQGLVHGDLSVRSLAHQRQALTRAAALFRDAGIPFSGFRAPMLRGNAATGQVVRELGFLYDSTRPVAVPTEASGDEQPAVRRALRTVLAAADGAPLRPELRDGVVHVPVALPDDALMVDRLGFGPAQQAAAWRAVLDATWRRGELFTLRLHPERIYECGEALGEVLADARARRPAVWIATLDRIARWWLRRAEARLSLHETEPGRWRIALEGDANATLVVRNLAEGDTEPWFGADRVARAREFEAASARKPVVGVSSRSPLAVLRFLAEEGYAAEVADDSSRVGAWVDAPGEAVDEAAVLAAVTASDGPVVRIGRWPAGARSALAITGEIACLTLRDLALRLFESRC